MPKIKNVNEKIHISVTPEQLKFINDEAQKMSVSTAAYVRILIFEKMKENEKNK